MPSFQRKYCSIILLIVGIITLSLKETFGLVHDVLYEIPDLIYQRDVNENNFYDHHHDPRQSIFCYGQHHQNSRQSNEHDQDSLPKQKSEKNDLEKTIKINLFADSFTETYLCEIIFIINMPFQTTVQFLGNLRPIPPTPPPDFS